MPQLLVNDNASYFTITNNIVKNSVGNGGIILDNTSNMVVTGNKVTNNTGWGIKISSSPGSSQSNNTVSGNSAGQISMNGTVVQ